VLGVNDQSLVVRCDADLLRSELAHVKAESEHLAASATLRAVVKHVAEIHLFQQVFTATRCTPIVRRLQPEKVIAQPRYLATTVLISRLQGEGLFKTTEKIGLN